MLLIVIIGAVLSEEILKDFETFYLTPNESINLRLHDYFSHNEIDFYISNTNMTGNDIKLKHDSSLNLISHLPTKPLSTNYTIFNKTFPSIEFPEGIFFLKYDINHISAYLFAKNTLKIEELWSFQIKSNTITQAAIYHYLHLKCIILVAKSLKNPIFGIWENEIYLIKFQEPMKPDHPRKLYLWDIKYTTDLKISDVEEQSLNAVVFFGRFKNRKQAVFLYDFAHISSGKLLYSLHSYIGLKEFENCEMNIVQAWSDFSKLFLLDSNLGLIIYKSQVIKSKWQYFDFIDLRKYGPASNMIKAIRNNFFQPIGISTYSGVIFTAQRSSPIEFYWVNTYNAFNALLSIHSIQFRANFLFMQVEANNTLYLMAYEFNEFWENSPQYNIANFDVKKVVDKGFNKNGMWMAVFFNEKMFYIRHDYDGIRAFLVNLKDWAIEITGNSSFYAEITGKSNQSNKKSVKKSFNVVSVLSNSLDIYKKNSASIDAYLYGPNLEIKINADSLYSGPNLTCCLINAELPSDITVSWSFPDHDNILKEIILLPNPLFIKVYEAIIIYGFDDKVIAQEVDPLENIYTLSNNSNIIRFWYLGSTLNWFVVSYDNEYQIFLLSRCHWLLWLKEYICTDVQTDIDCLFIGYDKQGTTIFCANQFAIDVYIANSMEKLFRIDKEMLGIDNDLYIQGLETLDHSSLYKYHIVFYVIYNSGIIMIDFPAVYNGDYSFILKTINIFHKDIKKMSISMESAVALLFSDCTIAIYDINLNYLKTLGPHLKGTIKLFISMKNILLLQVDNIIAVYDWTKFAFEALVYTINLGESCQLADSKRELESFMEIPIICQIDDKSILRIYKLRCNQQVYPIENKCSLPIGINIMLNQTVYSENKIEEGKISILAENTNFKSIVDILFNFHTNHNTIWIENNNLQKIIEAPYYQHKIVDLSKILHGNGIKVSILINEINSESVNPEFSPVHMENNFKEISSVKIKSCYERTYEIFVKNAKKSVINGINEFIIIDRSTNIPIIDSVLMFKDFIFADFILCDNFNAIDFNENIIIIFAACKYFAVTEEFWQEKALLGAEKNILLVIKYDFIKKSSLWSESNIWIPSFVENLNIVKLNNQRFEIFLYEKTNGFKSYANSCILRYKGLLNENGVFLTKIENIDFFSLGVNSFLIQSIDIILSKFGIIYLYIIDFSYGLRIIEIQENSSAIIIESIPHSNSNKFLSLSICQMRLFIMTNSMILLEYSINDKPSIKLVRSLFCRLNFLKPSTFSPKLTSCQDDCKYIIFTDVKIDLYQSTLIEVINLHDSPPSFFPFSTTVNIKNIFFIKNNVISFADTIMCILKEYSINQKTIEIPAISEENYKKMRQWWGTDKFYIQIQAENSFQKLVSDVFVLRRGKIGQQSSLHWFIWTLGGMILIFLGAAIACGIYYSKKRKTQGISNFVDDGVMMEEMSSI
ncbi:unnamed protein product [Blepharisma stoltei]|uniref:Uncharacterized protein n=1 Tax=Blepharisma stoltei TaxID=1481888 RepID=A0AAU9J3E8_9CILI|nr:unnamed protein product [Blepharisma stoltei]